MPAATTYRDATSALSGLHSSSHRVTLTYQMSQLNIRVGDVEEVVH
jgi:hypothetical protein